jgi:hypothetical protein
LASGLRTPIKRDRWLGRLDPIAGRYAACILSGVLGGPRRWLKDIGVFWALSNYDRGGRVDTVNVHGLRSDANRCSGTGSHTEGRPMRQAAARVRRAQTGAQAFVGCKAEGNACAG